MKGKGNLCVKKILISFNTSNNSLFSGRWSKLGTGGVYFVLFLSMILTLNKTSKRSIESLL